MTVQQEYNLLLQSGMFWEFFPEFTGNWEKDQEEFTKFIKSRNNENKDINNNRRR